MEAGPPASMHPSFSPGRLITGMVGMLGCFLPLAQTARATPTVALDQAAALLAVTPRTNLPPEADDPVRPPNLRLLKPGVWTDDVGLDDNGNVYNQYRRSSFGTWSNYDETKASPFPLPA